MPSSGPHIAPEHPLFQNKHLSKRTCRSHPVQGAGQMSRELMLSGPAPSQGWMGNGGQIPPCPSPCMETPKHFKVPRCQLRTTPIGLCLSCLPGNLLINVPCTSSLLSLSHLPEPLSVCSRMTFQINYIYSYPCLRHYSKGATRGSR